MDVGRGAGEVLEIADQVGLVEIAAVEGQGGPVVAMPSRLGCKGGSAGGPEAADTGEELGRQADMIAELVGEVLARNAQRRRQRFDPQAPAAGLKLRYGMQGERLAGRGGRHDAGGKSAGSAGPAGASARRA